MEAWKKESGLMDFQKEVVDCQNDFIILNWCRNASKTFTLAKLIEDKKPKNVIYVGCIDDMFNDFIDRIETYTKLGESITTKYDLLGLETFKLNNNEEIKIYSNNYKDLDRDIIYDYILYDDVLPYNINVKANKVISTISYNNYDKWLQRFYPTAKVFERDYKDMQKLDLIYRSLDWIKDVHTEKYFNEYAILDKPFNREDDKVVIACECNRRGTNHISEMIVRYNDEKGYCGYLNNCVQFFHTNHSFSLKERTDYLKDEILFWNGKRTKDYENIDKVMMDIGAGGGGIYEADILLSGWIDNEGVEHNGLIDKSCDIYREYIDKYPNAIDKLKLINVHKKREKFQQELKELLDLKVLRISYEDIKYWNEMDTKNDYVILLLAHRLYQIRKENNK